MTLASTTLSQLLPQIGQQYLSAFEQAHGFLPVCLKDEIWPSPCELGAFGDEHNHWQPVEIKDSLSFDNVEQALNFPLHASIKEYYTAIYSETIYASCDEGKLSLLFAWSEADFARLQENIIGHVLMKQRLKQQVTIFFALTDDDDYILSINNDTGEVWVERVGCEPHKKVADSLLEFIASLTIEAPQESN